MGCLNSEGQFDHWFGNIHLSGPCNRSCYFCIGQHMMALDPLNVLHTFPLPNLYKFINRCLDKGVKEVNITGSNTDPLLYSPITDLTSCLRENIPGVKLGIRTNGIGSFSTTKMNLFDKGSISITSLDHDIYKATMGRGFPPDIEKMLSHMYWLPKINIVLCPENVENGDYFKTIVKLGQMGIKKINLREPYGQPHIGNPLKSWDLHRVEDVFGMPCYTINGVSVVYWDVHYVEVESVNLYANGEISLDYPVTRGHCSDTGEVKDQSHFKKSRRVREQWVSLTSNKT